MQTGEYEAAFDETVKGQVALHRVKDQPAHDNEEKLAFFAREKEQLRKVGIKRYTEEELIEAQKV